MQNLPISILSLSLLSIMGSLCFSCVASSQSGGTKVQVVSATGVLMPPGSPMGHAQVVYTIVLSSKKDVQVIAVWRGDIRLPHNSSKDGAQQVSAQNTLTVFETSAHSVHELEADRSLPMLSVANYVEIELAEGSKRRRLRAPVVSVPASGRRPQ